MLPRQDKVLLQILWDYLSEQSPLRKADVIIAGGCKDMNVAREAARLFLHGWAPRIVFSGGYSKNLAAVEADRMAEIALRAGVPESAIIRERSARHTGENITLSQALLKGHTIRSVILVHIPYMTKRFRATALAQWKGKKVDFFCRYHEATTLEKALDELGDAYISARLIGNIERVDAYTRTGMQVAQTIPPAVREAHALLVERGYKGHNNKK
ncbi:MAG TPA: YdcF family protein [Verrucomicrobiae bacterium]|nr:YdcF family protein [Verrucomicrobiae bacterium]